MGRRLTVLAATAVVLLAAWVVEPAQASPPAATQFQVGIVVGEGPDPSAGHAFDFLASLVAGSDPVAGAPVMLLGRPYGATSFKPLASATSRPDGSAHASVVLRSTTEVKWVFAGDSAHAATESSTYVRNVGAKVVARAKDTTLQGRQRVVVLGRTSVVKAGQRVGLWQGDKPCFCVGNGQARIAAATVRPDGTFRLTARFAHHGSKRLFVKVSHGHGTTEGYSQYLRIHVR